MTQERAVATRESVLSAAARVFERNGYAGASIAQILEEGEATKGAMYFHFASKDELARAVINEQSNWRDTTAPAPADPFERMIAISHAFADALLHDPLVRASIRLTLEKNTFLADDDAPYRGWLDAVGEILREAQAQGRLADSVDPEQGAYLLTSMLTGLQLVSEAMTSRADLKQRVDQMWQILLPALTVPGDKALELLDRPGPVKQPKPVHRRRSKNAAAKKSA